MYLRAVGRRFTQMNAYFLVMNSKRCIIRIKIKQNKTDKIDKMQQKNKYYLQMINQLRRNDFNLDLKREIVAAKTNVEHFFSL